MRKNNFDFIRFLFAFLVVMGHMIEFSGKESLRIFAPYFKTYFSISGFFIISGFLITGSYFRTSSIKSYFIKRASRILPAYIFVVVVCAVLFSFLSTNSFQQYFFSSQFYKYLFANLLFLNFIQPCLPGVFECQYFDCSVNPALWTLKIEIAFYMIVPILIFVVNKLGKKKFYFFLLLYILSIIYKSYFLKMEILTGNASYLFLSRQLPGAMMYFVSGMILYTYFDFFLKNKWKFFFPSVLILFLERHYSFEYLTPIAFAMVIFVVAYSFKFLNNFGKYGDISYGIYIFHSPIIKTFVFFGIFEVVNSYLAALFLVLIVLLAGFASWHLIEKRWLKRSV